MSVSTPPASCTKIGCRKVPVVLAAAAKGRVELRVRNPENRNASEPSRRRADRNVEFRRAVQNPFRAPILAPSRLPPELAAIGTALRVAPPPAVAKNSSR